MSISRFQEKFLTGGCAKLFLGGMAAVFVGGLLYYGAGSGGGPEQDAARPVATIGNVEIPATAIDHAVQQEIEQTQQRMPGMKLEPLQMAAIQAGALMQVVDSSMTMYLARQNNVDFSNESVQKAIGTMLDQEMQSQRMQLEMAGQVKPGATDAEFEEFVKKQTNRTVKELKAEQMKQVNEALSDPHRKDLVMAAAAQALLLEKFKAKAAPSDEELRKGYTTVEVKRVLFKPEDGKDADAQAKSVLADLKTGKLTFEQAIDRYSKDLPQPNKRLSETTLPLPGSVVQANEEYAALRTLKAGEVSGIVDTPEGKAIYKVVKLTPNLPEDFEKNTAKYRDQATTQRAQMLLQKELDKVRESKLIKWSVPGYEVMYEFAQSFRDPSFMDPEKRLATMRRIYEKAKKISESGEAGSRQADLVAYAAFDSIYRESEDKAALADERIAVLNKFLESSEDPGLRLELVDLFIEKKDGDSAAEQLQLAAASNNDFESLGQQNYAQAAAKLKKLRDAKLASDTQLKQVEDELARWREDKVTYEKEKAEDEALRLKEEAEARAEEERLRKEDEAQQKAEAEKARKTDAGAAGKK